jgi:predicted DNA-binding ArsR family transcriptional regulator
MNLSNETLVQAVQYVLNDYENKFQDEEKPSLQQIADKANSGYTTINQIKRGTLKSLSIKKALEISQKLNGPGTLEDLIGLTNANDNTEARAFNQNFSHLFNYNLMPSGFEELIANRDFAKIIWAAFSTTNITRNEISYRWGKEGEDSLNFLLDKGYLKEEDGTIMGVAEQAAHGIESAYKQLGIGYDLYNINHSKKQQNWVSFQTNSVNEDFIKDFREDLKDLFKKFDEKSNTEKYIGNKKMFFGMILDTYMDELGQNEGKLQ